MSQQIFNVPEIVPDEIQRNGFHLVRRELRNGRIEHHRLEFAIGFNLGRAVHGEQQVRHFRLGSQHGGQHLVQFGASHNQMESSSSGGWASSGRNFFLSKAFS